MSTEEPEEELGIGALSRETGVSTATINFYVQEGVLPPPRKLNRTRALYTARHVRVIRLIRRLQGQGFSLAQVRGYLEQIGVDDAGLEKLESIGRFQPLPEPVLLSAARGAASPAIEPFEPVGRVAFMALAGIDGAQLERFEAAGLLRPCARDRYDHRDLWMLRSLQALLADGISEEALGVLSELLVPLRRAAPLVLGQVARHADALRARDLRMRDVFEPYGNAVNYLLDRLLHETDPRWQAFLSAAPEG